MAQPPQTPKCGQIGAMRCGLSCVTRSSRRRSGWPGTGSTSTISPGKVAGTKIGPSAPSATPSPRWPIRSMTRCSTTIGLDEEFAVAVATKDRRRHDAANAPSERRDNCANVLADHFVNRFVAHNALLAKPAVGFELWFDQRQKLRARRE